MPLLLHIDTATEQASVYLSENNKLIAEDKNFEQKHHASFVQPAIQKIFKQQNISLQSIDAVSVVNGPGSYTGLRVGLASAKGICYTLSKPLIALNTLEVMADAIHNNIQKIFPENKNNLPVLYCPMIDARRMEVFTAIYYQNMKIFLEPTAKILDENSFSNELKQFNIIFSGNGHNKLKQILHHPNAIYTDIIYTAQNIISLAEKSYQKGYFIDLAYSEPFYIKQFYSPIKSLK
ncbi:MAG: tRNA (adenosine(37)-N6)-threonylcarbamoyltransferase complex dimerization subunit type 1 TsaB [Chitinophagales bacterium]|nr:tRNA (adenosine(37)-N6)-threonylcarbamoyltransferase complex dimerization subunit type 1 TsaB [Chitinophagales bacterium]